MWWGTALTQIKKADLDFVGQIYSIFLKNYPFNLSFRCSNKLFTGGTNIY